MPTYEYECEKCGHHFERFQSMTEPPVKRCPKCRCRVRRLFGTGAGILFKGSGFYETDYRSSEYTEKAKKDKPKAESSGDSSKDTKKSSSKKPDKAKSESKS
jgi:putative FmdB family regulatory protein